MMRLAAIALILGGAIMYLDKPGRLGGFGGNSSGYSAAKGYLGASAPAISGIKNAASGVTGQ